ncbi:hypothetical protein [Pontivivens nitratireducens]|uniref:COG3904 family protein n=1 Tax=Pontivivens nitratireducens TaxID=2758038 RepID=UPI00163AA181|nr:hypothetical protein [Pontibrevibacter nitratireducens]
MGLLLRATNLPLPRILGAVLIAQLGIAGFLVWSDASAVWTGMRGGDVSPAITEPAAPGDQVRRYRPTTVPARDGRQGGPIPLPTQMEDMAFTIEETPDFGRVMLLSGFISAGTSDRFEAALDGQRIDTIALHSPGGVVQEALRMGQLVRAAEYDTLLTPDAACASACPLILFSGIERTVSRRSWVGMHQAAFLEGSFLSGAQAARQVQAIQGEVLEHTATMGVDPRVQTHALQTPPEEVYYLLPEQIEEYEVATVLTD